MGRRLLTCAFVNMKENEIAKKDMEPRLLTIAFHTRFFPALLWNRLRPRKRSGTTFVPTEFYIAFAICVVLVVVGLPGAINKHSIVGWVVGCTGLSAGIFAGALERSLGLGLLVSLAGLVLGYVAGICAGLWLQYLGWIAVWLDVLAGLAIIGMIVTDLMLLVG